MKLLICLSLLIVYTSMSSAAAFMGYSGDSDHPGKCIDRIYGVGILSAGQEINDPEKCVKVKCHEHSLIESYSCGILAPPKGCVEGKQVIAPYPKCCHREIICNGI